MTHAAIEVANDLARNGPSGRYSQAWMSRALQSLTSSHAEDVVERVVDGDRLAQRARHADDEAELELDVEARARAEDRGVVAGLAALAAAAGGSASR